LAIVEKVCRAISKGDSVKEACREVGIRPARLHEWTREDSVLALVYARAREQQAHSLAERAIAVSREAYGRDTAGVQAARLEVDTLKWYVSKIAPKLYGERLTIEDEGEKIVRVVFEEAVPPVRKAVEAEWELAED
jgi:transposase-like protein